VRTLYGKVTALSYLVIWPVTLLGGILIAAFGDWAYGIFVPGTVAMTLWAFDLTRRDPEADDELMPRGWKAWQVTWYQVLLGFELPRAWRTFKGGESGP
jgi:hypothetical protein